MALHKYIVEMSGGLSEKWAEWKELLKKGLREEGRIWTKIFNLIEPKLGIDRVNIALGQWSGPVDVSRASIYIALN